jgi:hypothetical protein
MRIMRALTARRCMLGRLCPIPGGRATAAIIPASVADDPILARQLSAMAFMLFGLALVLLALYLRLRVFIGAQPGGVDTWYYLASADALRRQKRLPIRLPQYLLHEPTESYPAGFPVFLALLPETWLRRYFWLVSPLIDTIHLLLLYLVAYRLTDSVLAASTAGLIYAVTPQLISETRNLNARAFASLLQTLAMLAVLRAVIPSLGPTRALLGASGIAWILVALVLIGLLYNTHTSTTIAFLVSAATLTVVSRDPRFLGLGLLGLPVAILLSGGYYLRVIRNHWCAARFWFRNVHLTRAHQVNDSPVLQGLSDAPAPTGVGLYRRGGRGWLGLAVRLAGENPFVLPMLPLLATRIFPNVWATYMYWWAVSIVAWAVLTTFVPPLRILGPGFHYMKASIFPTAYVLAVTVNVYEGAVSSVGLLLAVAVIASFAALAAFYRIMAARQTEHTAQTPPDLAAAAHYLRSAPGRTVLVLPNMYADYVAYTAGKAVVWGGHSGDLTRFEEFFPVLRRRLSYFFDTYGVDYLVLDHAYTTPARLQLGDEIEPMAAFGPIGVYAVVQRTPAGVPAGRRRESAVAT